MEMSNNDVEYYSIGTHARALRNLTLYQFLFALKMKVAIAT